MNDGMVFALGFSSSRGTIRDLKVFRPLGTTDLSAYYYTSRQPVKMETFQPNPLSSHRRCGAQHLRQCATYKVPHLPLRCGNALVLVKQSLSTCRSESCVDWSVLSTWQ